MDAQFENKYYTTDEMLSEYVHRVICRRIKLPGMLLSAVALAFLLITLYSKNYVMSAVFGVCGFITLCVALFTPRLTIMQIKENNRRIHNGRNYETVIKFSDNISVAEGTFSLTVEYSQIQKIYPLKHSYALMFGGNNGILVSLGHFTTGTFGDFRCFIGSKASLKDFGAR